MPLSRTVVVQMLIGTIHEWQKIPANAGTLAKQPKKTQSEGQRV